MYTDINFKSKKALKDAIKAGEKIKVYQPNDMFGATEKISTGEHSVTLAGPHYPELHRWYARADIKDGYIVKIS